MTIELKNVSKTYGEKEVLSDVSLTIRSHEFFVLVGASGGGKTTLLKTINRLIEPTTGSIKIDDQDIRTLNLRELRLQIGYVLQQSALFPNMTVFENIALIPSMKGWEKKQLRARVEKLLSLVDLEAKTYIDRKPHELSGGEAQRVGILRAIAAEPKILLMDEPFSALDPISRKQLQDLIAKLQRELKMTTIFVTHDMTEAMALADRIAILCEGKLLQVGEPSEVRQQPADQYVARLFENSQQDLSGLTVGDLQNFAADKNLAEALEEISK